MMQTAERSSHLDPSENVIFQRHMIAYKEAAKIVNGTVLEIGCGEGYGISELAKFSNKYIGVDKFDTFISDDLRNNYDIVFHKMEIPPLKNIEENSVDFVVTFQVIEHIQDDNYFLKEIFRVLKPGGKLLLTTPNKLMSLSRNPWHIREYSPKEMKDILKKYFTKSQVNGVYGNDLVMKYYQKNKESVKKITRFDIFNLQYILPRWMLQIPYDILNRLNRKKLKYDNEEVVGAVKVNDYSILESTENCLDYFCIATK
ncbi:MAG: class I SAM-dependent methyltransferase [Flavobacteriales bacterium]